MKEFIENAIAYAKANPILVAVIAACVLVVIVAVIAIAAKAGKNKKAKKTAAVVAETAKAEVKAAPIKEAPKAEVKTEPIKETPKAEVKTEPIKETPKAEVKTEPVKETPKAEVKTEPVKETPKAEVKTEPVKKEAKAPAKQPAKAKPVETTAEKPVEAKPATKKTGARYQGKWIIYHLIIENDNAEKMEEAYFFELHASNGELLLSSEEYTSHSGALHGIETHKANIEKENFKITLSKKGDYIFKLLNGKNTLLCTGANYATQARCESAVESTKRFAKTAVLQQAVEELHIAMPQEEEEAETPEYDESILGKWIVSSKSDAQGNRVYYFELFASNGEKLLSSEEYTTYVGAVNGISTHKTNIEKDNFRISLTKHGDYIFKLLSGNGQLLCLGEHYKTKTRCESAVESVKRFAKNSPVLASSDIAE